MTNANATGILTARPLASDIRALRPSKAAYAPAQYRTVVFAAILGRMIQLLQWTCLILAIWLVSCNEFYDTPLWMPLALGTAALSLFRLAPKRLRARRS